VVLVLKIYVFL